MAALQPTHTPPEEWLPIPGHEGHYEVSNHGRVRSLDRSVRSRGGFRTAKGQVLAQPIGSHGYPQVTLWKNHQYEHRTVHSLVAEAFLGTPPKGMEVCHNNGNGTDNRLPNLRYGTTSENAKDRVAHGNAHQTKRTHCPRGHKLEMPNLVARKFKEHGHRKCLACQKAQSHMHYHKIPKSELKRISDEYFKQIMNPRDA